MMGTFKHAGALQVFRELCLIGTVFDVNVKLVHEQVGGHNNEVKVVPYMAVLACNAKFERQGRWVGTLSLSKTWSHWWSLVLWEVV